MKKLKLGQELKIPESHQETLRELKSSCNANITVIDELSQILKTKRDKMWEIIRQVLPETEKYHCQYNSGTDTIKIISKNLTKES